MQHNISCDSEQGIERDWWTLWEMHCRVCRHPYTRTLNDEVHDAGHGKPAGSDALMPLETSEAACTACRGFSACCHWQVTCCALRQPEFETAHLSVFICDIASAHLSRSTLMQRTCHIRRKTMPTPAEMVLLAAHTLTAPNPLGSMGASCQHNRMLSTVYASSLASRWNHRLTPHVCTVQWASRMSQPQQVRLETAKEAKARAC